jgi:hypothetical protein
MKMMVWQEGVPANLMNPGIWSLKLYLQVIEQFYDLH